MTQFAEYSAMVDRIVKWYETRYGILDRNHDFKFDEKLLKDKLCRLEEAKYILNPVQGAVARLHALGDLLFHIIGTMVKAEIDSEDILKFLVMCDDPSSKYMRDFLCLYTRYGDVFLRTHYKDREKMPLKIVLRYLNCFKFKVIKGRLLYRNVVRKIYGDCLFICVWEMCQLRVIGQLIPILTAVVESNETRPKDRLAPNEECLEGYASKSPTEALTRFWRELND